MRAAGSYIKDVANEAANMADKPTATFDKSDLLAMCLIESSVAKKARHRQSSSVSPSGSAVAFLLLLMMTDNDDDNDNGDDNQIEETQFR